MSVRWTEEQLEDYLKRTNQIYRKPSVKRIKNKYGNQQLIVDGVKRDSLAESNRLEEIKILESSGYIKNLQYQVPFVLIASQDGEFRHERPVKYIADYVYDELQEDGSYKHIVEDCKGHKTKDYIIKRKLMLYIHGVSIKET